MKRSRLEIAIIVVTIVLLVTHTRYRFKHPEMTDTQLMQHTWDALMWR